ncbi:SRPBCC family protein [Nitrospirillum sp. BR 11828]|uniref:SRPBCC family protein n=1 Tax=Nitrospirillum sp. BR 11828 TaxID=3104325 RepID=UPI002ACAE512|nr:SRPBCC family protein [Nitrospirillum sp. BR 11828]MDZ5650010.1 SRPBCC family protein [Nitrospirillum sp. BR 11828]
MKHTLLFPLVLVAGVLLARSAGAHGPTPQKVDETVEIKASPAAVWAVAGDFAGIAKWDAEIKASEGSNKKRVMTLKNGEKIEEEVDEYDAARMTYTYRMLDPNLKALPASSYSATLVVTPGAQGTTQVQWYARVYRGDTGNEPPDELNDEAAKTALSQLFKAGLQGIKAKAEGKS